MDRAEVTVRYKYSTIIGEITSHPQLSPHRHLRRPPNSSSSTHLFFSLPVLLLTSSILSYHSLTLIPRPTPQLCATQNLPVQAVDLRHPLFQLILPTFIHSPRPTEVHFASSVRNRHLLHIGRILDRPIGTTCSINSLPAKATPSTKHTDRSTATAKQLTSMQSRFTSHIEGRLPASRANDGRRSIEILSFSQRYGNVHMPPLFYILCFVSRLRTEGWDLWPSCCSLPDPSFMQIPPAYRPLPVILSLV